MGIEVSTHEIPQQTIDLLARDLGRAFECESISRAMILAARYSRMSRFNATERSIYFPEGVALQIEDPELERQVEVFEALPRPERKVIEMVERLIFAYEQFWYRRKKYLDKNDDERRVIFIRRLIEDEDELLKDVKLLRVALNLSE